MRAARARLITTFIGLGKLGLVFPVPPQRVRFLNPGERLELGDRALTVIKPPLYDAPETTAVTDLSAAGTWTVVLSSDRATSFECSLDGGAWQPCGPVKTFTGLSKGRHTLAVRAVDSAGTADPTPAQLSTTMSGGLL